MSATKLSKLMGKVSVDARYIFRLGPRDSLYCKLRAKYWDNEHLRNLEIARWLLAIANKQELSDRVYAIQCAELCKLENVSLDDLQKEGSS